MVPTHELTMPIAGSLILLAVGASKLFTGLAQGLLAAVFSLAGRRRRRWQAFRPTTCRPGAEAVSRSVLRRPQPSETRRAQRPAPPVAGPMHTRRRKKEREPALTS
jgi:hypothetical protein